MSEKMIVPADVQALLEAYDYSDQRHSDSVDLINGLRDLLHKLDYPANMLGMWAVHPVYGRVLVCSTKPDLEGEVAIALRDDERKRTGVLNVWVDPTTLSFPEQHPDTLTTAEDYKNAPEGTIVADNNCLPLFRCATGLWRNFGGDSIESSDLGYPRQVLRWGWVQ